ncbi:MAG: hypothetical protein FWG77_05250 [Treponema sp.]|nr:hypothetical protein [Treponema sp.]
MIDHKLIDNFTLLSKDFAVKWKNMVRKTPQLSHYNTMDDNALIELNAPFYPLFAKTLDRGLDRNLIGNFFASMGKVRMEEGYPISEVIYALTLAEKVIIEYLMTEFAPESTTKMYQSMGVITKISEFCLMGCFYLTKGYLEAVYTKMNINDRVSEELLKRYFKDDFFFKQE